MMITKKSEYPAPYIRGIIMAIINNCSLPLFSVYFTLISQLLIGVSDAACYKVSVFGPLYLHTVYSVAGRALAGILFIQCHV